MVSYLLQKDFFELLLLLLQRPTVIVQEDVEPLCRSCGEDDKTSYHVLAECPAFAAIRLRVLGTLVHQGTHSLVDTVC